MSTYPYTREGLTAALAALGNTHAAIGVTLAAGGHRGNVGHCETCPIAAYLRITFPKALRAVVAAPTDPIGAVARLYLDGSTVQANLPSPVIAFVDRFDAGFFRQLRAGRPTVGAEAG